MVEINFIIFNNREITVSQFGNVVVDGSMRNWSDGNRKINGQIVVQLFSRQTNLEKQQVTSGEAIISKL